MTAPVPITKLTIDRSKWACYTNNYIRHHSSFMEDQHGFKCCLGFLATACGVSNFKANGNPTYVSSSLGSSRAGETADQLPTGGNRVPDCTWH